MRWLGEGEFIVGWPKRYKQLPEGYVVIWSDSIKRYLPMCGEQEGPSYWDQYATRMWCFRHAKRWSDLSSGQKEIDKTGI